MRKRNEIVDDICSLLTKNPVINSYRENPNYGGDIQHTAIYFDKLEDCVRMDVLLEELKQWTKGWHND